MLKDAWQLVQLWGRLEEPNQAPPFLPAHVAALVGYFLRQGLSNLALGIAIAFHLFLRTGELVNIRAKDALIDPRCRSAVINLGFTKGGKRRGLQESVILDPL